MPQDLYLNTFGTPPPFNNPPEIFWNLITETIEAFNRRHNLTDHRVPDEPFDTIWISYFHAELNEWIAKFTHTRMQALHSYQTAPIFWVMFATSMSTPEVREACQKLHPAPAKENHRSDTRPTPAPQKIHPQLITRPKKKVKVLYLQTTHYQGEPCEQFLERNYPRWPWARLYRFTKSNNYHNSGVKEYWVLCLSQYEHARKSKVSLRTDRQFFSTCKRHGICMKVIKEDPEAKLCAIWVFAKTMRQAQRLLRKWRSERPRLRKRLLRLRLNHTS